MTSDKTVLFSKPSWGIYAAMVVLVLYNIMMWSGMMFPSLFQTKTMLYLTLREYFYYILLMDGVLVFYLFSDLILAWDERDKKFRTFHLIMSALTVSLVIAKFLAFVFGFLLPFYL